MNEHNCQICNEVYKEENMKKVQLETFRGEWVCKTCLTDLEPQA